MKTKTWDDIGRFQCPTWGDIGNETMEQKIRLVELSVRSTLWVLGKDEDEIREEVIRRLKESKC